MPIDDSAAQMATNFRRLDIGRTEISRLLVTMLQARDSLARRSWSDPLEHTGEEWWADVLSDPRARRAARIAPSRGAITVYRLRDEPHESILIACTKCDWKAAFNRDELIAKHGADRPMPELLSLLAAPSCSRVRSQWDRCGVYYVEPIEGA
jgi:hypothetical protein